MPFLNTANAPNIHALSALLSHLFSVSFTRGTQKFDTNALSTELKIEWNFNLQKSAESCNGATNVKNGIDFAHLSLCVTSFGCELEMFLIISELLFNMSKNHCEVVDCENGLQESRCQLRMT